VTHPAEKVMQEVFPTEADMGETKPVHMGIQKYLDNFVF
jgi:hypothetical protein